MICDICKKKILTVNDMNLKEGINEINDIDELPMPIKIGERFYHISCYNKKTTDPEVKLKIAKAIMKDVFSRTKDNE